MDEDRKRAEAEAEPDDQWMPRLERSRLEMAIEMFLQLLQAEKLASKEAKP